MINFCNAKIGLSKEYLSLWVQSVWSLFLSENCFTNFDVSRDVQQGWQQGPPEEPRPTGHSLDIWPCEEEEGVVLYILSLIWYLRNANNIFIFNTVLERTEKGVKKKDELKQYFNSAEHRKVLIGVSSDIFTDIPMILWLNQMKVQSEDVECEMSEWRCECW